MTTEDEKTGQNNRQKLHVLLARENDHSRVNLDVFLWSKHAPGLHVSIQHGLQFVDRLVLMAMGYDLR